MVNAAVDEVRRWAAARDAADIAFDSDAQNAELQAAMDRAFPTLPDNPFRTRAELSEAHQLALQETAVAMRTRIAALQAGE